MAFHLECVWLVAGSLMPGRCWLDAFLQWGGWRRGGGQSGGGEGRSPLGHRRETWVLPAPCRCMRSPLVPSLTPILIPVPTTLSLLVISTT